MSNFIGNKEIISMYLGNKDITSFSIGEQEIWNPGVEPEPEPSYTSARYFKFNGNTVTKYIGTDNIVTVPRSYSIEETQEWQTGGNEVNSPDEWDFMAVNYLRDFANSVTFSNGEITKTYESGTEDWDIFNDNISVAEEFENVFGTSSGIKMTSLNFNYDGISDIFDTHNNMFIYPIKFIYNNVTYEYEDYDYNIDMLFRYLLPTDTDISMGQNGWVTVESFVDGNDYQVNRLEETFKDNTNITDVTLLNNITNIGDYAFYGCSSLQSITIPNSVTSIGNRAFQNCTSLSNMTIPNNLTSIGYEAFSGCSSLTSAIIPNSVISIGSNIFANCNNLTSVTIGNGLTRISNYAFYNCKSLTSITIPNGITSIGDDAFRECTFSSVNYTTSGAGYTFNNGILTILNNEDISSAPTWYRAELNPLILDVIWPNETDNITSIGTWAFQGCSSLTDITFPEGVTNISGTVLNDSTILTNITLPSTITNIDDYAAYYCNNLNSITLLANVPPIVYSHSFSITNDCTIYVPAQSVAAYKSASGWSEYADRIQAIQE